MDKINRMILKASLRRTLPPPGIMTLSQFATAFHPVRGSVAVGRYAFATAAIQKQTSTDPRSTTDRPPPATSALWCIASSGWVAGKISIFAARCLAFALTLSLLPVDIFRRATRMTLGV
jgi:hypothetical protein